MRAATCVHCGQPTPVVNRASVWYMHDDHTFTKIEGDMARIRIAALALAIESTYGMLCPVILLADNVELRRVGVGQHAGPEGLTDKQFNEWRASVLADADAARLLADVGSAVQG